MCLSEELSPLTTGGEVGAAAEADMVQAEKRGQGTAVGQSLICRGIDVFVKRYGNDMVILADDILSYIG